MKKENICDDRKIAGMEVPGSHAGYAVFPAGFVRRVPRGVGLRTSCLLADVLAVADSGIRRAEVHPGNKVAIYGAGPIGLTMGLLLKKAYGVRNIYVAEPADYRRRMAHKLFESKPMPLSSSGFSNSFDVAYETSGTAAGAIAGFRSIRRGGELVLVGVYDKQITLPATKLVSRHIRISGSFTYPQKDLLSIAGLANRIGLQKIITHELPLARAGEAYRLFAKKQTGAVLLVPSGKDNPNPKKYTSLRSPRRSNPGLRVNRPRL